MPPLEEYLKTPTPSSSNLTTMSTPFWEVNHDGVVWNPYAYRTQETPQPAPQLAPQPSNPSNPSQAPQVQPTPKDTEKLTLHDYLNLLPPQHSQE